MIQCRRESQQAITYSKSSIEILEQAWKLFKVYNKDTRTKPLTSFRCPCNCKILPILFCVSFVDFEQETFSWACMTNQWHTTSTIYLHLNELHYVFTQLNIIVLTLSYINKLRNQNIFSCYSFATFEFLNKYNDLDI